MTPEPQHPPTPSGLPVLGHTLEFARDPFEFTYRAIDECGNIYRLVLPTTEIYVLAHPDYFKQVLVTDVDEFEKTDDFEKAFGEGVIATDGNQWRRQRNVLQPLFHRDRVTGYGDYMVNATQRRLDTWSSGEVRDIESEMQDLTLEILFATLFGRELPPGDGEELRTASDGLNRWFAPTSWMLPNWVPTPSRREFFDSKERLRTEIQRLLVEHDENTLSADLQRDTLLSKLDAARNASGQNHLRTEEVEGQLLTMLFAGYETTAAVLGFAWYALAVNPDIRRAFHEELDTVLDGTPPTHEDIDELDLTSRIVTETLRMYPPVHTLPRQTTQAVEVGGYHIPAETQVHLPVLAVHRNERFYDDPDSFRPDRWTSEFENERPEYAFVPFGGGRRTCIGRDFARLEATLVLATIGQQWTLEWANEDTSLSFGPEITMQTKDGLPMRLASR
ncbi:cytochrome P450 [Haladaptatus caseinilyticus]|uniref:cytochrome P450 n=1 Tax=Haladaptatus caseinilyticus TaxID=2993314 RepID=UPI00224B74CB|nr:cytochrome P450 [Haladaptatus caseinilyticus]